MKYLTTKIIRNISFRVKYPPPIIISSKHLTIQTNVKNIGQNVSQSNIEKTIEKRTIVKQEYPEYPNIEYDILYYLEREDKK